MHMFRTYLDWASAAPVSTSAWRAFVKTSKLYGNPSSPHKEGDGAHIALEKARTIIARIAGVKSDGVIFTSGATEANAIAIQGHVKALLAAGRDLGSLHLLYLPTAHASVVETMEDLRAAGAQVESLALIDSGAGVTVDLTQLQKQLRPETVLVSMDAVCGETGTKYHTRDVRRVIMSAQKAGLFKGNEHNRPLLHVDASQAPFTESIECNHLGADLLTLDAQKIGGVRGVGALIRTNPLVALFPLMHGGGQEQGIRPGTESPALAASFAVALTEAQAGKEEFNARAAGARSTLLSSLKTTCPDLIENVGREHVSHILNISLPHRDTDYLVMLLSQARFSVSTKSACETDATGSRVVLTMTHDSVAALSTLRISWGPTTNARHLKQFAKALTQEVRFLDERCSTSL